VKAEELLKNPALIGKVKGFVWQTAAPPAVLNYEGELLDIKGEGELCTIKFRVKKVKGVVRDYELKEGSKLILIFKNGNIRFYTDAEDSKSLFKEALGEIDRLFGPEYKKTMEKRESSE
jgi:hypothetical protein